jgi:hypothetical protein
MALLNRWIIYPKVNNKNNTFTPLGIMIYVWIDIFGGKLYQQITLASNWYELKTNSMVKYFKFDIFSKLSYQVRNVDLSITFRSRNSFK